MKKRQAAAALLTMAMIGTALAGCGSTDGASATESSEAAAEETAEDIGAEAEEAADAEDTAAEDAAGEEEAEADGEEFMPADFIQERAGTNEFDDYEDILRYLEGDEGYAYISIDGSTAYVLAVSDELYAWDDNTNAAMGVSLYAYDADGKLTNAGTAYSNGTAYPIRCNDGTLYVCGSHEYGEMKISEETGGLFYTKLIDVSYADDGTESFSGFVRENGDINEYSEDIGVTTWDEFQALFTAIDDVEPISFYKAEYDSYDAVIAGLKPGDAYAYLQIDGYDGDILAVTDYTYQWDNGENAAITAYLYEETEDGKAQLLASVLDGGTNYPIRCTDGVLYATGHAQYGEMTITKDDSGRDQLTYTRHAVISYDTDQKAAFETEGDVNVTTEDEFYALYDTVTDMAPVDFQIVE